MAVVVWKADDGCQYYCCYYYGGGSLDDADDAHDDAGGDDDDDSAHAWKPGGESSSWWQQNAYDLDSDEDKESGYCDFLDVFAQDEATSLHTDDSDEDDWRCC